MSAREAFAWSYGKTLNVGTTLVPTGGPHCTAASVATAVKSINSAVAARERAAVDEFLRKVRLDVAIKDGMILLTIAGRMGDAVCTKTVSVSEVLNDSETCAADLPLRVIGLREIQTDAAADALREAADAVDAMGEVEHDAFRFDEARWLRARAYRIEKGEA